MLGVSWATGLLDIVQDGDRFQAMIDDAGLLGPVVYVVLMTTLIPVGIPGLFFVIPASLLWPAPVAVTASVLGGVTSSVIGVWAARRVGREALEARMPRWLEGADGRLTRTGVWGVIVMRVALYLLAPVDWVIGLSRLTWRPIVVGTAIGLIPPTIGYTLGGRNFFTWLVTPVGLVSFAIFLAVVTVVVVVRRRRSGGEATPQEVGS